MNYINVNWQHNIEGARQYFLQVENVFYFCFLIPELTFTVLQISRGCYCSKALYRKVKMREQQSTFGNCFSVVCC